MPRPLWLFVADLLADQPDELAQTLARQVALHIGQAARAGSKPRPATDVDRAYVSGGPTRRMNGSQLSQIAEGSRAGGRYAATSAPGEAARAHTTTPGLLGSRQDRAPPT
jgi:hypothetical protein